MSIPFDSTGHYVIGGSYTTFDDVVLDPEQGVTFDASDTSMAIQLLSGLRTTKNISLHNTTLNYDYQLSSQFGKPYDHKAYWLNDSDGIRTSSVNLAVANLTNESVSWPSSDAWASATGAATAAGTEPYPYITWAGTVANTWYASTAPVRGGDEIFANFDTAGLFNRLAIIRTTAGYYGVYASGGGAAPIAITKLTGSTGTSVTVGSGSQFTTQPQYYAENCVWSIRIIDRRHFVVLLNGVAVYTTATAGDIYRAGFGVMPTGAVTSMSVAGWTKTQTSPSDGLQPVSITCFGDSLTADIHGGWPYAMREALDGSNGIRVINVANNAVSGDNSTACLAKMQAVGVAGYSFCVIGIGTNDIQGNSTPTAVYNNLNAMLNICQTAGVTPIFWVPPLWYSQAEAGTSTGQATTNYGGGSPIRSMILRFCAWKSIACIDLTKITGPIDVRYLNNTGGVAGADSMVRDNIHPTAYGYKLIGHAIARRILGLLAPAIDRSVAFQQLSPTMQNSWTDATANARISYATSHDGKVTLAGVATAGTKTDGTTIFVLPENLRPASDVRFAAMMNQSVAPNYTSCLVQIDLAGNVLVYGVGSANYISLDNISFCSAG